MSTKKHKNNMKHPFQDFLEDPSRPIAKHKDDSFEDAVNKTMASPLQTPRTLIRAARKEMKQGSPIHPLSPPTPSSSRKPRRSSSTTTGKTPSPRKSPRLSQGAQSPSASQPESPDEQPQDEDTIDSGSPNLNSQEDPDVTIDSGAPVSSGNSQNKPATLKRTPPRGKETTTAPTPPRSTRSQSKNTSFGSSTKSQSKNISFVSSGLSDSPPVPAQKPGWRKDRVRKRGRRDSHILDTTTDKSGNAEDEEEGEEREEGEEGEGEREEDGGSGLPEGGILSPSYDSPPPSPVAKKSTPTASSAPTTDSPSSPPLSTPPSPPRSTSASTTVPPPSQPRSTAKKPKPKSRSKTPSKPSSTDYDPNISLPLPSPPERLIPKKRQKGGKKVDEEVVESGSAEVREENNDEQENNAEEENNNNNNNKENNTHNTSLPLPSPKKLIPKQRQRGGKKTDEELVADRSPEFTNENMNTSLPLPSPKEILPKPRTRGGKRTSDHITTSDAENENDKQESPADKRSTTKKQRGVTRPEEVVTKSTERMRAAPIRKVSVLTPNPNLARFESQRDSISGARNPNDISIPLDTPPRWRVNRKSKSGRPSTILPDSPDSESEEEKEEEERGEEKEQEERGEEKEEERGKETFTFFQEEEQQDHEMGDNDYEQPQSSQASSGSSQPMELFTASGGAPSLRVTSSEALTKERGVFTDSPHPTATQNMDIYKDILQKSRVKAPIPNLRMVGGQKAKQDMDKKKQQAAQRNKKRKATVVQEYDDDDDDDLRFPKKTTEDVYYDFAKKKISKEAMNAVHKGVNNFWASFCKNIEEIRIKEGKGRRKKIILDDIKQLAEKMRFTNEMVDFNSLLREMLPKELQECLIPIARAGNVVGVKKLV